MTSTSRIIDRLRQFIKGSVSPSPLKLDKPMEVGQEHLYINCPHCGASVRIGRWHYCTSSPNDPRGNLFRVHYPGIEDDNEVDWNEVDQ